MIELSNEGIDRVRSSVSYTLSANVEELVLTGSLAIDGIGNELDNRLVGNDADNALYGGIGKDILNGRGGDDILIGGEGNDVYIMGHGYGVETIVENDATVGNMDAVRFLPGISTGQIWFQRMDDNLEISIIGTSDKLVVNNWYLDSAYQIEQFRTADGMTLYNSQVDGLVDAMANFAPLGIGEITMPMDYAQVLDPVITALWL
ncbi:calcium-binding protein [Nitrosomonas europaea]|uniref:calcium-binding protein n=1 Tax=Nitrosomonas europaea TaxID=915 RepID=UPI0032635CDB